MSEKLENTKKSVWSKRIMLKFTDRWTATFTTKDSVIPITTKDLKNSWRTIKVEYRRYLRDLRLAEMKRLREEKRKDKE